jgi:hypothetical protein
MSSRNLVMVGMFLCTLGAMVGCDGRTLIGVVPDGGGGTVGNGSGMGGSTSGSGGAGGSLGGLGGVGDGGLGTGAGGMIGTDGPSGSCPQAGTKVTLASVPELRAALARTWILCSPLGLTNQPQDGLVITTGSGSDDRYDLLKRDASGVLVPQQGVDFEGTITYLVIDPSFGGGIQTNFTSDLGGTVISRPVITENPAMLIINDEGVYEYRYVAADAP